MLFASIDYCQTKQDTLLVDCSVGISNQLMPKQRVIKRIVTIYVECVCDLYFKSIPKEQYYVEIGTCMVLLLNVTNYSPTIFESEYMKRNPQLHFNVKAIAILHTKI